VPFAEHLKILKNNSKNSIEFLHVFYLFLLTEIDLETRGTSEGAK